MRPQDLLLWRGAMGFRTQTTAAKALGYSRSRYHELESGRAGEEIPVAIALACAALYAGILPWPKGVQTIQSRAMVTGDAPAKRSRKKPAKQKAATRPQHPAKAKKPRKS